VLLLDFVSCKTLWCFFATLLHVFPDTTEDFSDGLLSPSAVLAARGGDGLRAAASCLDLLGDGLEALIACGVLSVVPCGVACFFAGGGGGLLLEGCLPKTVYLALGCALSAGFGSGLAGGSLAA
jgi:hypothetical protein